MITRTTEIEKQVDTLVHEAKVSRHMWRLCMHVHVHVHVCLCVHVPLMIILELCTHAFLKCVQVCVCLCVHVPLMINVCTSVCVYVHVYLTRYAGFVYARINEKKNVITDAKAYVFSPTTSHTHGNFCDSCRARRLE